MTTSPKSTTNESTSSRHKRRRRPAHTVARQTEAGTHALCGAFIPRSGLTRVPVDRNHVPLSFVYYPCPGCASIRHMEEEMENVWPMFRLPADLALDMADVWEIKK